MPLWTGQIQAQFAHGIELAERFIAVLCKVPPKLLKTDWTLPFPATNQTTTHGTIPSPQYFPNYFLSTSNQKSSSGPFLVWLQHGSLGFCFPKTNGLRLLNINAGLCDCCLNRPHRLCFLKLEQLTLSSGGLEVYFSVQNYVSRCIWDLGNTYCVGGRICKSTTNRIFPVTFIDAMCCSNLICL